MVTVISRYQSKEISYPTLGPSSAFPLGRNREDAERELLNSQEIRPSDPKFRPFILRYARTSMNGDEQPSRYDKANQVSVDDTGRPLVLQTFLETVASTATYNGTKEEQFNDHNFELRRQQRELIDSGSQN